MTKQTIKLSKAIDLITRAIDGHSNDYPEIVEANEILCELFDEMMGYDNF